MYNLNLEPENSPEFWIFGQKHDGKQTDQETQSIIAWAWRSLYAATVKAHLEEKDPDYKQAIFEVARYIMSRTLAYGIRWKIWFNRQKHQTGGQLEYPEKRRNYKLIAFDEAGNFTIAKEIKDEFDRTKKK